MELLLNIINAIQKKPTRFTIFVRACRGAALCIYSVCLGGKINIVLGALTSKSI